MVDNMVPLHTPKQLEAQTRELLRQAQVTESVSIVGIRGYYLDTMGEPGKNDRGIYDDAIFVVGPECYVAFNANCDPSFFKQGIANLLPGVWKYKIGIHGIGREKSRRYKALVQSGVVGVTRDGGRPEYGMFGINIHRGSNRNTSSLGCQTIHPDQWPSFIGTVEAQMKKCGQSYIPYLLVENKG